MINIYSNVYKNIKEQLVHLNTHPRNQLLDYIQQPLFIDNNIQTITKYIHFCAKNLRSVKISKQGTNVAHNIMGGLQIIAMFHL